MKGEKEVPPPSPDPQPNTNGSLFADFIVYNRIGCVIYMLTAHSRENKVFKKDMWSIFSLSPIVSFFFPREKLGLILT